MERNMSELEHELQEPLRITGSARLEIQEEQGLAQLKQLN